MKRAKRVGGSSAPSRSAAIGGTRVARRAGANDAASVTPMPTASGSTTPGHRCTWMPASGRPKPTALKSAPSTFANPTPARRPITDAITPTVSASPRTVVSTCRRIAPTVRSMANSRMRWATVIEKVLKMTNAPTSTAAPAKASRAGVKNAVDRVRDLVGLLLGRLGAGLHLDEVRQRRRDAGAQLRRRHARVAVDRDRGRLADAVVPVLGVGERGRDDGRAADRRHVPELEDADDRHRLRADRASSGRRAGRRAGDGRSRSARSAPPGRAPRGSGRRRACSG